MQRCLLVLAKFPLIGRVKTRLAASIGDERATLIQTAMLLDTLDRFLRIRNLVVTILHPEDEFSEPFLELCRQNKIPEMNLRVLRGVGTMNEDIVYGYRQTIGEFPKVALIGADLPHYSQDELESIWLALDAYDAVYHPNEDDGCCPHGLRCFADLWTGNDSRAPGYIERWELRARLQGLSCKALTPIFDIDRLDDLLRLKREAAHLCPYTMSKIRDLKI